MSPEQFSVKPTNDKMQCCFRIILMAVVFILVLLSLHVAPFFNINLLKSANGLGKVAPIRLKSKWKPNFKYETPLGNLSNEITILTAYFNIGAFMKGSKTNIYTPKKYLGWMKVFGRIRNKLVVYTDDKTSYNLFVQLREKFPATDSKIFFINRTELWSFQIRDNISEIYKQPNYPKHLPNTVYPEYSCAMHAKFELLSKVIKKNYYKTKYFMWLDIGLFRALQGSFEFGLSVPADFDESKVAYSHVFEFRKQDYRTIVYHNLVWVGGASNLGRYDVLYQFTQEYLDFVKESLRMKLMDTDQQIIYGMYVKKNEPKTELQLYKRGWFKLGYVCYQQWLTDQDKLNES